MALEETKEEKVLQNLIAIGLWAAHCKKCMEVGKYDEVQISIDRITKMSEEGIKFVKKELIKT